eukprot:scaffold245934_cov22-Tisochrysis_lutea.AAC.1
MKASSEATINVFQCSFMHTCMHCSGAGPGQPTSLQPRPPVPCTLPVQPWGAPPYCHSGFGARLHAGRHRQ